MWDTWRAGLSEAVDFALCHGLVKLDSDGRVVHAPFTLNPFTVGDHQERAMAALTASFNRLAWRTASAPEFLRDELSPAARSDPFLARLLDLAARPRATQPLDMAITRSDYFLLERESDAHPVQVELNTIAASYPALAGRTHVLHRHVHRGSPGASRLIPNDPLAGIASGIAEAVRRYGVPGAGVLMVVQPGERNRFDQRWLEFRLGELEIPVLRASLDEIGRDGGLRQGHLVFGAQVAAVTYFRAGYGPEDYAPADAWRGRELIERSDTIAVPSAAWQLAGSKKVQQALARRDVLARFCDPADMARVSATFAGLYDLEQRIPQAEGALPAWRAAIEFPDRFVLKPQREGGGNNLFDDEMRDWLQGSTRTEREAFILMERLRPRPERALMVSEGTLRDGPAVSEIGRFGVFLSEGANELINEDVGYLVRTKPEESREGGVSAGFGFLSSLARE